jgi:hypothetical protein
MNTTSGIVTFWLIVIAALTAAGLTRKVLELIQLAWNSWGLPLG